MMKSVNLFFRVLVTHQEKQTQGLKQTISFIREIDEIFFVKNVLSWTTGYKDPSVFQSFILISPAIIRVLLSLCLLACLAVRKSTMPWFLVVYSWEWLRNGLFLLS